MVTIHTGKTEVKAEAILEDGIEEVLHSVQTDVLGELEAQMATAQA
ncbi:hypothetical protein LCGC14_3048710, partial [marine sediment metagenome]